jgi:hypothetical protein
LGEGAVGLVMQVHQPALPLRPLKKKSFFILAICDTRIETNNFGTACAPKMPRLWSYVCLG